MQLGECGQFGSQVLGRSREHRRTLLCARTTDKCNSDLWRSLSQRECVGASVTNAEVRSALCGSEMNTRNEHTLTAVSLTPHFQTRSRHTISSHPKAPKKSDVRLLKQKGRMESSVSNFSGNDNMIAELGAEAVWENFATCCKLSPPPPHWHHSPTPTQRLT